MHPSLLALLLIGAPLAACDLEPMDDGSQGMGDDDGDHFDDDKKDDDKKDDDKKDDDKIVKKVFKAKLEPLNDSGAFGTAEFIIEEGDDDRFTAIVNAEGVAPEIKHLQHVHAGTMCPTGQADINADGYVDVLEGVPDYGLILIPLDSELSEQIPGEFPFADAMGMLSYMATTSFDDMLADLMAPDPNVDDAIVKLAEGEELELATRTVVLHGVAPDTDLPDTVASLGDAPATVTLPIACGEIVLVSTSTAEGDDDKKDDDKKDDDKKDDDKKDDDKKDDDD